MLTETTFTIILQKILILIELFTINGQSILGAVLLEDVPFINVRQRMWIQHQNSWQAQKFLSQQYGNKWIGQDGLSFDFGLQILQFRISTCIIQNGRHFC